MTSGVPLAPIGIRAREFARPAHMGNPIIKNVRGRSQRHRTRPDDARIPRYDPFGNSTDTRYPRLWPRRTPFVRRTTPMPIIDTHQHLWDLAKFRLPWV